ncbi:hypothetical protein CRE_01783 [Caenorhabditis remanei]|uniref:FHA domain-containing protein n=1 Tax=Caenorhabditis remanei TaxID=31234 RepID=E3LFF9_CAERE|nr:hypothetical protein CRE_01783 [Caenorhabditis remanei]
MSISGVKIINDSGQELFALRESGSIVNFGRDKKVCHITFDPHAARVSRVHASIEWTNEDLFLIDKSKEGTLVNGKRVKQSKEKLVPGTYHLEIGGIPMSVEVEEEELEETVLESDTSEITEPVDIQPTITIAPGNIKKSTSVSRESDDDFDDVSSITTFNVSKYKHSLKRKSDATLFDDSQPRGKRGPVAPKPINFDDEMENHGKKGTRARKADESVVFEDETPAKKSKTVENKPAPFSSQQLMKKQKVECDEEMESIVDKVAAIPSVSQESNIEQLEDLNHSEMHFDRGPAAPNETIKYANLIFHQPDHSRNVTIRNDPSVPNFKRFIPKGMRGDGRTSAASMYSNNTSYNTTIQMVDARKLH